ncbi:ribosomal protein S18-alanine N-acetyltransferase [Vagococcus hydrophili]|uniref:Ribosomal protein S18-alanine N-acetyltransferase n=1 Tax=Vagococcus hydrophili TaxID=2714947 RepID=A0A6G8AWS3_9ENTE|nr:ribosomal protein S18-alanine N-acetyltransferase [Vagococcus hydrophili]QIL49467.1 ribosomal protein S18-alanine N-acetyltransferase [Vagococcus hydrophili]
MSEYRDSLKNKSKENLIRFEIAKVTDIYLFQDILKEVYGKSPWSNTIFWLELTKKQQSQYIKAVHGSEVLGFIGIRIMNTDAHVTNLAVLPKYQHHGIGKQLLDEAKRFAKNRQCLTMSLEVKKTNYRAVEIYKNFGFYVNGIKPRYYKEDKEDAVDMFLILEES